MEDGHVLKKAGSHNYLPERKTAQGFQLNSNQERFILCCNHWKSKSGSNVPEQYKDKGDGQGAYNPRRVQEAEATLKFIKEITKTYNDPDVLATAYDKRRIKFFKNKCGAYSIYY